MEWNAKLHFNYQLARLTNWLTNQLTPRKRAFFVNLTVLQLFTKFAEFYGKRRFVIVSQEVHLSASWARIIRPMYCIEAQQCNVWWSGSIVPVIHVETSQDWGLASRTVFLHSPQHPVKEPPGTCRVEGWLGPRTARGLVESKKIPVLSKASWAPETFGVRWNRMKYLLTAPCRIPVSLYLLSYLGCVFSNV